MTGGRHGTATHGVGSLLLQARLRACAAPSSQRPMRALHCIFLRCPGLLPQHLKPHQKEGFQFIWNALELDFRQVSRCLVGLLRNGGRASQ